MSIPPFMTESLVFLPTVVSFIGIGVLILASIMQFRQGHIGRIGIAGNAFLLWQIFYPKWNILPGWFQWYLNLGTIFAVVAIISYLFKFSMPSVFYDMAFWLYGSLSIIFALIILL
jgi:hypothetical protein